MAEANFNSVAKRKLHAAFDTAISSLERELRNHSDLLVEAKLNDLAKAYFTEQQAEIKDAIIQIKELDGVIK
jgi:hypothetical protein